MTSAALVIHPRLRVVSVIFAQPKQLHALLIALNYILLEASDDEFPLPDVLIKLKRLSQSHLSVEEVIDCVVVDFEVGTPDDVDNAFLVLRSRE
jgi:hypothetical protein